MFWIWPAIGSHYVGFAMGSPLNFKFEHHVGREFSKWYTCSDWNYSESGIAMIDELHVKDLALIREARLHPSSGLTVITGETGAGKTALLGALKLLAGERGEAALVREGAAMLEVQARVFAHRSDDDSPDDGMVVRRTVSSDGRSRVHQDGAISSVKALAEVVGSTIDLCGQHAHQLLLKPAYHCSLLDSWAHDDVDSAKRAYDDALATRRAARAELDRILEAQKMSQDQVEQARYVANRIGQADPREGEYEELCALVPKAENGESLMRGVSYASSVLSSDGGALDVLAAALSSLREAAAIDSDLDSLAESLQEATYIIEDVARDAARYRDEIDFDSFDLEQMQERMALLQGLMRTWGPTMEDVFEAQRTARETVRAFDSFGESSERARLELERADEELKAAGERLHAIRTDSAPRFACEVTDQMARLELQNAQLECRVDLKDYSQWDASGPDRVEFLFKPGKKLTARPLAKIASGGEVSRVMLAIKVVLGASDKVETLVFDEVDAGVGGSAARALSDVLVDLASTHQVIVVTHLAQVAAPADVHYIASKSSDDDPQTTFTQVDGDARIIELARMLSGDSTEASLAHARELLRDASFRSIYRR